MADNVFLKAIDALIERWKNDDAKSIAESRQESAEVIRAVIEPVIDDLERRLEMARGILIQIHSGVEFSRGHCIDCDAAWFIAGEVLAQLGAPVEEKES